MKSILTMAWTAEDPAAFDLAARLARSFGAKLVGLEPPSYGVMSMAWADAGMGAPIGGGLAEDAEERQRVAAVRQAFEQRAAGLAFEWRSSEDSGPTAIGTIGRAYDLIVMPQPGALPKMPESVFETALFDSGRPVLVVPQGFAGMVGKRILFAWNGSTESARAISLAMPVLAGAESIDVLSVDTFSNPEVSSYRRDRPELLRLLDDIRQGKIDIMICVAFGRICRSAAFGGAAWCCWFGIFGCGGRI